MTKSELMEIIRNGESSFVEFKLDSVSPNELAEVIVSFANSVGGSILLGVDDSGEIKGVERKDIEEWLMNICRNNCLPGLIPFYEKVVVDEGKTVAILRIPKGLGTVYRTNRGRWLIRVGSTCRDVTPEEMALLLQQRGMVHYDIVPVPKSSFDDLDPERLRHYWKRTFGLDIDRYRDTLEDILINARIMTAADEGRLITIAGMLIFGREPERFLPQTGITAVRFRGREMDYNTLDRKDISGPLVNSYARDGSVLECGVIEQAEKFVSLNTAVYSKMDGIVRKDIPQYPRESIRETIVNAVAHRHYSLIGSKIRLFIFDDRLEVRSPGRIPNGVTIEQMKRSAHYARNPVIVKFLQHYGYVEDIGLGIPNKIIRLMIEHSGKEPKLEEAGEEFTVTLYPAEPLNS